jgi:cyclopropane fatty-acyl-phospholipid synthase-like methyltransferase
MDAVVATNVLETKTMSSNELPEFFYEIFDTSLPRLNPGDEASTLKALNMLRSTEPEGKGKVALRFRRILDLGCGCGGQTLSLARHTEGSILALDNHQPYLDELRRRAEAAGLSGRIQVVLKDMHTLTQDDGPFDLIWSEGALFVMGFREGLATCHSLQTPGGGLAVSELCWLRPDPPAECRQFFSETFPAMTDVNGALSTIRACGYEPLGHFTVPESAWWTSYYHPVEERLRSLRKRHAGDAEKMSMMESIQMEIDIYRQYSAYYGSEFFVMRRR